MVSSLLMVEMALLLYDPEILWCDPVKMRSIGQIGKYEVLGFVYHTNYFISYLKSEA